uniref:Uncharacterized protein n=1 Tax=Anguilla anguilla TaxID=7936 RepID=A0A0E9UP08_ANGAN
MTRNRLTGVSSKGLSWCFKIYRAVCKVKCLISHR